MMLLLWGFVIICVVQGSLASKGGHMGGNSLLAKSNRVVGGRLALKNEIPYIVGLVSGTPPYSSAFCGGSIIAPRFVLTAAHCFKHSTDFEYSWVLAGSLNARVWEPGAQAVEMKKIIRHERFDPETYANDIAIIELVEPLKFNEGVQPISIPPSGTPSEGKVRLSGWGETLARKFGAEPNDKSDLLKTVELEIVPRHQCLKYNREIPEKDVVHNSDSDTIGVELPAETHICAGSPPTFVDDGCNGDSGGPLVCSGKVGQKVEFFQCGVVSAGAGCGNKLPGWYTEVSQFHDWIFKQIQ